jgi:two-component system, OmpR family, sensor kinase
MAVGLVVASAAIWVAASRVLRHQLDQGLTAMAFIAATEVAPTRTCEPAAHAVALDALRYQRQINRFVVFRDPACAVTRAVPGWAADLPVDTAASSAARSDRQTFSESRWHGMDVRSTYLAVADADTTARSHRVVQVAASLEPVERLQWLMLFALVGIVVVGTGATLVGAGRLADSAVRPVKEITEQATHIAAGTLDQRLSAHATAEEYRGLVGVLNSMLDRLSSAFTIQRRFTSDVSHELRSPLTALRGEIEVTLRNERTPREYQIVLHSALEEIERMTTMTEELLLINRVESRQLALRREPTDLLAVARQALEALRHRIAEKELRIELAGNAGTRVEVDPDLMRRLLDELLDNAVTYSDFGGAVTIRLEQPPGVERVVVEDTGPGIAAADLPHLFEPYYRADQARTRGTGTGLGLTAALAIARLHDGVMRAMNRPTGGARFEVDLPLAVGT